MVLSKPLNPEEREQLLNRVHRALIFGDYTLVAKILVNSGIKLSDRELAAWIRMGGTWVDANTGLPVPAPDERKSA